MSVAALLLGALLSAPPGEILVSNRSDVVNGLVASPDALRASPGPDGISLREALLAANATQGPHRIGFDLQADTVSIALESPLPAVTVDGITIAGPADPQGEPRVTVVAAPGSQSPVLSVRASKFTLCHVAFAELRDGGAVAIRSGVAPEPPIEISDFVIHGNRFHGLAGWAYVNAVTVAVENGAKDASVTNVAITSNVFAGIANGDSVGMGAGASEKGRLSNVVVIGNDFLSSTFGVEIATAGTGGRVEHVVIARNRFLDNFQPLTLTGAIGLPGFPAAEGNVTRDVTVTANYIRDSANPAIALTGGLDAVNSSLEDLLVANNVIAENRTCGICGNAGGSYMSRSTGNAIRNLHVVNNTITGVGYAAGIGMVRDLGGLASGNQISGIRVVNTLFANEEGKGSDFGQEAKLVEASFCLTADRERIGMNGNLAGEAGFLDRAGGDYRLGATSDAIDAGTGDGAPRFDREGLDRRGAVDIGAHEFAGLRTKRRAAAPASPCPP